MSFQAQGIPLWRAMQEVAAQSGMVIQPSGDGLVLGEASTESTTSGAGSAATAAGRAQPNRSGLPAASGARVGGTLPDQGFPAVRVLARNPLPAAAAGGLGGIAGGEGVALPAVISPVAAPAPRRVVGAQHADDGCAGGPRGSAGLDSSSAAEWVVRPALAVPGDPRRGRARRRTRSKRQALWS